MGPHHRTARLGVGSGWARPWPLIHWWPCCLSALPLLACSTLLATSLPSGCHSSKNERALPPPEARRLLIDRNWIDRVPQSATDRLHVFRFVPSMGGGVSGSDAVRGTVRAVPVRSKMARAFTSSCRTPAKMSACALPSSRWPRPMRTRPSSRRLHRRQPARPQRLLQPAWRVVR